MNFQLGTADQSWHEITPFVMTQLRKPLRDGGMNRLFCANQADQKRRWWDVQVFIPTCSPQLRPMHSFAPKYPLHVVATGALGLSSKSSFPTLFEDLNYLDAFQDCKPQKETSHKSGCSSNGVVRILLLSFAKPQILALWALWGQQTARCKNNKLTNPRIRNKSI